MHRFLERLKEGVFETFIAGTVGFLGSHLVNMNATYFAGKYITLLRPGSIAFTGVVVSVIYNLGQAISRQFIRDNDLAVKQKRQIILVSSLLAGAVIGSRTCIELGLTQVSIPMATTAGLMIYLTLQIIKVIKPFNV